ncbi:MAG: hypothetical protein ACO23R_18490, partial [bacterium]
MSLESVLRFRLPAGAGQPSTFPLRSGFVCPHPWAIRVTSLCVAKEKVLDYSCEAGDRNLGEVKILPREPSPEIEARKVNLKADVA